MKKVLSLMAIAGLVAAFAAPAQADEFVARYTYLVNGAQIPASTTLTQSAVIEDSCGAKAVITQPAVLEDSCASRAIITQPALIQDSCASTVITQPAVVERTLCAPAVVTQPVLIEKHEKRMPHLFHLGLFPLVDFSLF